MPGNLVDLQPFVHWVDDLLAHHSYSRAELAELLGIDPSRLRKFLVGEQKRISIDTLDEMLSHKLGRPDLLSTLYPDASYSCSTTLPKP